MQPDQVADYDSTADTLKHSLRVGELMGQPISELVDRSVRHDRSKTEDPELAIFNEYTPKLRDTTYGSDEYKGYLDAMGEALRHHYAHNSHHPEFVDRDIDWRPIAGYDGRYEVSNKGDVRSLPRTAQRNGGRGDLTVNAKVLKAFVTPKGYLRLQLAGDTGKRNRLVHRLVAEAFLPNPDGKPEVNHRDGNKRNNHVGNLEWATESENLSHAYTTGLKEPVVKYVVHCPELDLTTLGTAKMAEALVARGYENANPGGVWTAMDSDGTHIGLRFEGTLLTEFRRSQIAGMTLVDLIEMLADWRAATERHADGSLVRSLDLQKERFGISDQLAAILWNTARHFRWLDRQPCGDEHTAPDGTEMVCNVEVDRPEGHEGPHADGRFDGGQYTWGDVDAA